MMSYKIQITVDEELNNTIKNRAKKMELSVSSYARLTLMSALPSQNKLLSSARKDVKSGNVEGLTIAKFNQQLDNL